MNSGDGNLRASVIRGFFWVGTGSFVGQFLSWIVTIVVVRLLTPSDYGLMAMCASFVSSLALVSELGVSASLVQAKQITDEEIRKIYGFVILSSIACVIVGHVSAPLVAQFYDEPRLTLLIRVMNVSVFLTALYIVPQSIAIRRLDFKRKTWIDLGAQVGGSVLTLILALSGAGVWTLVWGLIFGHVLRAIWFGGLGSERVRPLFDFRSMKGIITYGLAVTGDRLAYLCYSVADTVIIGKFLGNSLLGMYGVAINLASLPSEKILPIVTQVSFASYSQIQTDRERIGRNIVRTIHAVSFIAFPGFFLMAAIAPEAIPLVLGEKWEPIVVPFQLLCLVMPLKALSPILPTAVFATGEPTVNLVNMIGTFVVMATAFLVGVNYGVIGVCIAWVTVYPVVFFLASWRCLKVLDLQLSDMFREMWFPFLASVSMVMISAALRANLAVSASIGSLVVLPLCALGVYGVLVFLFRRDEYLMLKGLFVG